MFAKLYPVAEWGVDGEIGHRSVANVESFCPLPFCLFSISGFPSVLNPVCVCVCVYLGYVGEQCELKYRACLSSPCNNGATCLDDYDDDDDDDGESFRCQCAAGFTGPRCSLQVYNMRADLYHRLLNSSSLRIGLPVHHALY